MDQAWSKKYDRSWCQTWVKILLLTLSFVFMFEPAMAAQQGFAERGAMSLEKEVFKQFNKDELIERVSAVTRFAEWGKRAPDSFKLYVVVQWTQQGYLKEALELLDLTDPKFRPELWSYYRATLLTQLGQLSAAEPFLQKLKKKFGSDVDFLFLQSGWFAQSQNFTAAIEVLGRVLKRSPRHGRAFLQRGLMYLMAMSYDLALEDLKRATKFLPKSEIHYRQMAHLQMGLVYLKVHLNEIEARRCIERGVKLDPDSALVQEFYAKIR